MDSDIEKLLSEEEGENKDVKEKADPAPADASAAKKGDEEEKVSAKEHRRVVKALKDRQDELDRLKAEKKAPENQADPNDPLATREGWLKHIEEVADKKADAKLAPLREATLKRARDKFLASHPELSAKTPEAKEALRAVLEEASPTLSGLVDEESMVVALKKAWASENYDKLEAEQSKRDESRRRAQQSAAQAADVSSVSEKQTDDFSEEELREAERFGMSPEEYRKAEQMLGQMTKSISG